MKIPTNLNTLAERFKWARQNKKMLQEEVARELKVTQQSIAGLENGNVTAPRYLYDAAALFGVPFEWLKTGEIPINYIEQESEDPAQPTSPLYGFASAENGNFLFNDGTVLDHLPRRSPNMGRNGFYMIVTGDSMEPRFEQGDKIAVSRSLAPRKGRYCVIEFIDGTAALKRFISMTEKEVLCEQLNPKKQVKYNRAEIVGVYSIVGVEF